MQITVIIPTLDVQKGRQTARMAHDLAGMPSGSLKTAIAVDSNAKGFVCTVNRGLEEVNCGDVCLLNDDARPDQNWLAALAGEMEKRAGMQAWFAGPSGPCRTPPQSGGRIGDRRRPRFVRHLSGFCLLVAREAIETLGGLDERFTHYAGEVDWQWRAAQECGARSLWVPGVYVDHEAHLPTRPDWWKEDHRLLREIWEVQND